MYGYDEKVHTTLNLSKPLMREAESIFKGMSKTEIIHEALERMVRVAKIDNHLKKWKAKGRFKPH